MAGARTMEKRARTVEGRDATSTILASLVETAMLTIHNKRNNPRGRRRVGQLYRRGGDGRQYRGRDCPFLALQGWKQFHRRDPPSPPSAELVGCRLGRAGQRARVDSGLSRQSISSDKTRRFFLFYDIYLYKAQQCLGFGGYSLWCGNLLMEVCVRFGLFRLLCCWPEPRPCVVRCHDGEDGTIAKTNGPAPAANSTRGKREEEKDKVGRRKQQYQHDTGSVVPPGNQTDLGSPMHHATVAWQHRIDKNA